METLRYVTKRSNAMQYAIMQYGLQAEQTFRKH